MDIRNILQDRDLNKGLAERVANKLRSKKLMPFSQAVWPNYEVSPHHSYIAECLEKAERRENDWTRLIIHEPPQHGKSLQISKLFPSHYLGNNPNDFVILTAYGDEHAQSFSRDIRNIIDGTEYQAIFPGISLSPDSKARFRWNLCNPYKGGMVASGLEGRLTGVGADLLIIDDPYKNRQDAESKLYNDFVIEQYKSTLRTRVHKNGIIVLVMTRWVKGDLADFLMSLQKEGFRYICLPAFSNGPSVDPLKRPKLFPLWPSRYPQAELLNIKDTVGSYNWSSMYQGNPVPAEGALFKRQHFDIVDKAPEGLPWVRFWDLATSESDQDSFTASFRMTQYNEDIYIDARVKIKKSWPEVRGVIKETCIHEQEMFGDIGYLVGIESQGPQKGMVQECWADPELISIGIIGVPVASSKRIRALPVIARGETGKLHIVRAPWNEDFINEALEFDKGQYMDQIDAISGCFKMAGLFNIMAGTSSLSDYLVEEGEQVGLEEDKDLVFTVDGGEDLHQGEPLFYGGL